MSIAAALVLLGSTGCHSAFVQTTITNAGPPISGVELDYPSQGFGTSTLGENQAFHYRFKVQGSGPLKIAFTDAHGKQYTATGPTLREGAEGTLGITIDAQEQVAWTPALSGK